MNASPAHIGSTLFIRCLGLNEARGSHKLLLLGSCVEEVARNAVVSIRHTGEMRQAAWGGGRAGFDLPCLCKVVTARVLYVLPYLGLRLPVSGAHWLCSDLG